MTVLLFICISYLLLMRNKWMDTLSCAVSLRLQYWNKCQIWTSHSWQYASQGASWRRGGWGVETLC